MIPLRALVLTDHQKHSRENSLYALTRALYADPRCTQLDVASRGSLANADFFAGNKEAPLQVVTANEQFAYDEGGTSFIKNCRWEKPSFYQVIFLRLPPPLSPHFLSFLRRTFPHQLIINAPEGIEKVASKAYLLNFADLCPPIQLCNSWIDIINFKHHFPIVLKPLNNYGGNGLVRIDGNRVWEGQQEKSWEQWRNKMAKEPLHFLGVKYLHRVSEGDKRIIVVNGEIIGASLRLPPPESWICNVAQGGSSIATEVSEEELHMIKLIDQKLLQLGVVYYGVDTLVNDQGKRVLSEINVTSIGGLMQLGIQKKSPIVEKIAQLLWDYIIRQMTRKNDN